MVVQKKGNLSKQVSVINGPVQAITENDRDFVFLMPDKKKQVAILNKPFDSKKNLFVPLESGGFAEATVIAQNGDDVTVKLDNGNELTVKADTLQQMNPPKFDKINDMATLTCLNEASVLHNLTQRYYANLIYTYSGLFLVAINPYRKLPIYDANVITYFKGRRRNEVPPHLFAVSDTAYQAMLQDKDNQSLLITGESGAGKTENTKKVIHYYAAIAAGKDKGKTDGNLEDQIIQANPVLEAYGNAKTIRNNNSSRFGKFIRIHFGPNGKIAGADVETYLLEKSRVISQQANERNFHIFYQLLSNAIPQYCKELLMEANPSKYLFINQGTIKIDSMDDREEFELTETAFDTLGFSQDEKMDLYKCTAAVCIFGNAKWKQRPREEQAEIDGLEEVGKVAYLLGINENDLVKGLLKPRIKVGNEYVQKGQNKDQVTYAVGALSKSIYERLFKWLVSRINKTLDSSARRQNFIGVLDIAGFEIFKFNSFEQLCINYTNECLQQFFNHHMFVLEQEEYRQEGIKWQFIDFGMDLQACIDLIEKPMGILSILEEECMFPKASDKSFVEKLIAQHDGKSPNFHQIRQTAKSGTASAHFEVVHYAGTVPYNANQWLEKNMDPVNETVVNGVFTQSNQPLMKLLYSKEAEADDTSPRKGKKKTGSRQTISSVHRFQLNNLMSTLRNTAPHFVRCIIPNEKKSPELIDAGLVLHQLKCNGVLEGIRICRKGFPNRIPYAEFKQRYTILDPTVVPKKGFVEPKKLCEDLLKSVDLPEDNYRYGQTKIFFRAGVVAELEDMRDTALTRLMIGLQCWIRGYNTRQKYKKLLDQMVALGCLQRNIRSYLGLKKWPWWHLYTRIKPLLFSARMEEQYKEVCADLAIAKENLEKGEKLKKEAEETNLRIIQEKNELMLQLQAEKAASEDSDSRCQMLITQKGDLESQLQEIEERLMDEEDANTSLSNTLKKMENEAEDLKKDIEELEQSLAKADQERINKENQMKNFQDEMTTQDDVIAKLNREKKMLEDTNKKLSEDLQTEEDKVNHMNKLKSKLDGSLDEVEDKLEKERKARSDLDKVKRKLETELKQTNSLVEDLERMKKDLEETCRRKDVETNDLMLKLEGEQVTVSQASKKLKETTARLEELEEELEVEKQNRLRAEKQRADLAHELDDLTDRLDEAGGRTVAQTEVSKKQEQELIRMRQELEEANINHDATVSSMKKKHQDIIAETADQIDQMQKMKNKNEKDKSQLQMEHDELLHDLSQSEKAKQSAEKLAKQLEAQLSETSVRLEESSRNVSELSSIKQKLQNENNDLLKGLEEAEHHVGTLTKQKQQLTNQLEDTKRNVDDETQTKNSVANNLKIAHADLDALKEQLEEEMESKSELQRNLSKANTDIQMWKAKYEQEGLARTEELEESKKRLAAKLIEAEEHLEATLSKCSSLEKAKSRMAGEIEDLTIDVERANANLMTLDKKQKQFDKTIAEWKGKHDELLVDLETSQKDARGLSTEVLNLKSHLEESTEQANVLQRENKKLIDENSDLADQLGEGGRSVHELDKARRQLESDKEELLSALEEAETALEQEEAKMVRAQLELSQIRQDVDRRLAEKEEEFENTRKNHARAMESMQASLEGEQRSKQEMLRLKKKLESDINDLEVSLDNVNRSNSESIKQIKKLTTETRELQTFLDDERKNNEELKDAQGNLERKIISLNSEANELQATLDSAERAKKAVEMELQDSLDRIQELTVQNSSFANTKRKLEQDIQALHADLDEAMNEFRSADERAKKAAGDATLMAEELKREQDISLSIEKQRKSQEQMVRDLQVQLEEAEATALKGGKKIIAKLEDRIRELESDLDVEQRRHSEAGKNLRKTDRRLKELSVQTEDDRKNMERMQETIDKHQAKLKTFKRQVEEAEEVASMNLSKFRKVQQDLEEAEERADVAESTLAKVRAKNRSTVSTTRLQTPSLQHTRLSMPPQSAKANGEIE